MATFVERDVIDEISINPDTGAVRWRVSKYVDRDGVQISHSYHRTSIEANYQDFPNPPTVPAEVEQFRVLVQTPEKIAKSRAKDTETANKFKDK
jgi:nitrate reductase cytochrome c-type subunit